ncbi:MAG TPA: MYXO-CTERM sorting domain-containing protein [Polyangiaceae bacterium]|nr:MYXO-CTERM sorting domain-containing protein [Polyangiaceae bacterium]
MNLSRHHHFSSSTHSMSRAWLLSLGLLGAALGVAAPAAAQQAASCDLDCPLGTTCELAPVACPAIACAVDSPDCPVCDGTPTPYCAPAACEADSDCDESMRCAEHTAFDCGAVAEPAIAPASGDAAPSTQPEAPACEPDVIRQCTPRWQLPCSIDSDCGDGFRCEETEACSVPGYDPSSGEAPSSEVTCERTGTFACVVVETACSTNADCPASFDCVDNPNGTCSSSSNGETQCTTPDPARLCAPRVVASPASPGDVAVPTSAEGAPAFGSDNDAAGVEASASEGGCSLGAPSPSNPLALLSTVGLGLALLNRRRRSNAH